MYIEDNKLAIITESKTVNFDLSKDLDNNLKYEINFIIKHNKLLAEHTMKNEISQLLSKYKHGNTENSKTNEPHTCVFKLWQKLDSRSSNEPVALQNLSIYYRWKNIRQRYKN